MTGVFLKNTGQQTGSDAAQDMRPIHGNLVDHRHAVEARARMREADDYARPFGHQQAAVWMAIGLPVAAGLLFLVLWLPDLAAKRNKREGK